MNQETESVPVKRGEMTRPARSLVGLRNDIDRMFDSFLTGWPSMRSWTDSPLFKEVDWPTGMRTPNVDVSEDSDAYQITAELPGLDEKQIEVTLKGNLLTLKGEKKEEREDKKEKEYYVKERHYGSFQRSFSLPDDVDTDKISTAFRKGLLTVDLPKSSESKAKTRKIEVKA